MDAQRIAIAKKCQDASYDKAMDFPAIVGLLIQSGFDGYAVDYRLGRTTYYLPDGDTVALDHPHPGGPVAAAFDQPAIAAQVRWAQANPPDYSYAAFCTNVKAAGCAGYVVSFPGRRVLYYGRTAETHTEFFPQ